MKPKLKLEHVQNLLEHLQKNSWIKKDIFLHESNKLVSLTTKDEFGCIYNKTDYMSLENMNQFLRGYMYAKENKISEEKITYYIFGGEVCRIINDESFDGLIERLNDDYIAYGTYVFIEGIDSHSDLMSRFCGWDDYCIITKEEYEQLISL